MMRRKRPAGLTLIELVVAFVIVLLLLALIVPSLSVSNRRPRSSSSLANMSGLFKSCIVAAYDSNEIMPGTFAGNVYFGVPRQKNAVITVSKQVGERRDQQYTSDETKVSPTRPFWNLIRAGMAAPRQFINRTSANTADETEKLPLYYDFTSGDNVSYGYQCPYGNPKAAPTRSSLDIETVLIADRGPYFQDAHGGFNPTQNGTSLPTLQTKDTVFRDNASGTKRTDFQARKWNSPNEKYEGVGYVTMSGAAKFEDNPFVGKGRDNIYTYGSDSLEAVSQPGYDGRGFLNGRAGPTVDPVSPTHPQPLTNYDSYIVP